MRRVTWVVLLAIVAGGGCGKKTAKPRDAAVDTFVATPGGENTAPATTTPKPTGSGVGNTNYQPGAGAVVNVRQAGRRTVAINDMSQLGLFIEQLYTANGKMPTKSEVLADIARDAPKIKKAIEDGDIVLTGTTNHEGLWAHEVEAETKGGIVLVTGRPSRATAAEVTKWLGK